MANVSRDRVNQTLMHIKEAQLQDLERFRHHLKWTVPLTCMHLGVDRSTAYRRLNSLLKMGLLDRQQRSRPQTGGSRADLYYLTDLGAVVLSKHLQLGSSYITAPSVSCSDTNDHDLLILEVAIRLTAWDEIRHRQRMVVEMYQWASVASAGDSVDIQLTATGECFRLVPDLALPEAFDGRDLYIEVEQTPKWQHVRNKYRRYEQLGYSYRALRRPPPWLYVIFGNQGQEAALAPMHQRALSDYGRVYLFGAGCTNADAIRGAEVGSVQALGGIVRPFDIA